MDVCVLEYIYTHMYSSHTIFLHSHSFITCDVKPNDHNPSLRSPPFLSFSYGRAICAVELAGQDLLGTFQKTTNHHYYSTHHSLVPRHCLLVDSWRYLVSCDDSNFYTGGRIYCLPTSAVYVPHYNIPQYTTISNRSGQD